MTTETRNKTESDRSIGTILTRLLDELSQLLRGEILLAKEEAKLQLLSLRTAAVFFACAFIFMLAALLALLASANYGFIAAGFPPYSAAALTGVIALALAGVCAYAGARSLNSISKAFKRTSAQAGEDARLIKESFK